MDLNEIQCFKVVAESGSFTEASKISHIPKSTLSRKVFDLEQRLGVSLLRRTTRQVTLTDTGREYLQICQRALADLEQASQFAETFSARPHGKLRVAAPLDIASTILAGVTVDFCEAYPDIELEFVLDDRVVDLIEEKIDLAIRAGHLPDSSLKSHKLGTSEFKLFASPAYLKRWGAPKNPKELEKHRCLNFTNLHAKPAWVLRSGTQKQRIVLGRVIGSNQLSMIKTLALHGAGIALIPVFISLEEEKKKNLIPVLPAWSTEREPVYAVYPAQKFLPARTRLFLDFLKENFSVNCGGGLPG